jgi:hypothetical protein
VPTLPRILISHTRPTPADAGPRRALIRSSRLMNIRSSCMDRRLAFVQGRFPFLYGILPVVYCRLSILFLLLHFQVYANTNNILATDPNAKSSDVPPRKLGGYLTSST